jgi:hypothetical protein
MILTAIRVLDLKGLSRADLLFNGGLGRDKAGEAVISPLHGAHSVIKQVSPNRGLIQPVASGFDPLVRLLRNLAP